MDDLVAWLRSCIDEDEALARGIRSESGSNRPLLRVEAHRAILDQYDERFSDAFIWHPILRALALAYRDRLGYREEWRPQS